MAAAVLTIDINARLASLEQAVSKIPGIFGGASRKIETQLAGLNSQLLGFGRTALAAFGVPLGIAGLVTAIDSIREKTAEGERSLNQLNAVIKATGKSAGLTASDLEEIGKGIQGKSIFDDDAIRAAETALLRFRSVQGDTFRQAIALAPDVASALGVDLPTAAIALGKAMTDPEHGMKALKAAGLALSDQEKDLAARMIEVGDKAGAQKLVLDLLTKSVGGASEADNSGLYGASKRLGRSWDDLQKAMGRKIFADQGQGVEAFTSFLDRLIERLDNTKVKFTDLLQGWGSARVRSVTSGMIAELNSLGNALISPPSGRSGSRSASGRIGGITTPEDEEAAAARRAALQKEIDEAAYNRERDALKKRADDAAASYSAQFATLKTFLGAQSSALDFSYRQNELSDAAYYAKKRQAAEDAFQSEFALLQKEAAAQLALKQVDAKTGLPRFDQATIAAADARLDAIAQRMTQAEAGRDRAVQQANQEQSIGVKRLVNDYEALNVQLLALTGNTVAAANAGFALAHREDREKIAAGLTSPDADERARAAAAGENLDRLAKLTDLQARLNNATTQYSLTLDEVAISESLISSARESGALTELQSLSAISAAREGKLDQLRRELAAVQAIAAESGKREDIVHAEQLRARLAELAATGDLVAKKFNDIGSSNFSNLLQSLASGKNALDSIKDFSKSAAGDLTKVFADDLAQRAFGKDGIFSGFGSIFSKMFGGKETGAVALTGSATALTSSAGALTGAAGALSAAAGIGGASSAGSGLGGLFGLFGKGGSGFGGTDPNFPIGDSPYTGPSFGTYAVGTSYVPRNMFAKLHRGERVVTADQNRNWNQNAGRGRSMPSQAIVQNIYPPAGANYATLRQTAKRAFADAAREARRG